MKRGVFGVNMIVYELVINNKYKIVMVNIVWRYLRLLFDAHMKNRDRY